MTTACIARILRVSFLFAGWTGFLLTAVSCGGSDIDIPDSYGQMAPDRNPGSGSDPDPDPDPDPNPDPDPDPEQVTLTMVDPAATAETQALYSNLWTIASRGFMFGHHDDLWYGRYWYDEPGGSDTKAVCGDYPAVFSVDFGPLMDDRFDREADMRENEIRRRVILEAYERGEVVTACCHLNNPLTGGDSWDNSHAGVVKAILDESTAAHAKYMEWLDRVADFANNLRGSDGRLIPVIFRPYHEHTQEWSWWGSKCTTEEEFVGFWRMTVRYLRDTKGVHNFIYAISPQMDAVYGNTRDRLLFRWPGDEWVDFIGMDCYHGLNTEAFTSNLRTLSALSQEKLKPCGVTETGQESFEKADYWTGCILAPLMGQRVSMVVMWRNKYVAGNESDRHFYSVYPGHVSADDFNIMYGRSRSLFSGDLPDMYTMAEHVTVR